MNIRLFKDASEQKNTDALYRPIKDGDIIISLNKTAPKNTVFDTKPVIEESGHAVVYFELDIMHSTPSRSGARVKNQSVHKGFEKEENFGTGLVLSCKDPTIRANIIANCKLVKEAKAFTPFAYYDKRREDFSELKQTPELEIKRKKLEFFRAFRTAYRIKSFSAISQNKGISCGNFVSYITKSAIINTLFPDGLPEEIQKRIVSIENTRTSTGNKKLDKVDEKEFDDFEKTVIQCLPKSANLAWLQDLYRPVKKRSVNEFVAHALNSDLWEFGYFFYDQGATPSMMSHKLYASYDSLVKEKKGLNLHHVKTAAAKLSSSLERENKPSPMLL